MKEGERTDSVKRRRLQRRRFAQIRYLERQVVEPGFSGACACVLDGDWGDVIADTEGARRRSSAPSPQPRLSMRLVGPSRARVSISFAMRS
jgi:hypothetical protein